MKCRMFMGLLLLLFLTGCSSADQRAYSLFYKGLTQDRASRLAVKAADDGI
jgi:hypothetical protein